MKSRSGEGRSPSVKEMEARSWRDKLKVALPKAVGMMDPKTSLQISPQCLFIL